MDKRALERSLVDLESAIVDSLAVYKKLLIKTASEADQLKSLETEVLRDVVDAKTVLSSQASRIEERRQTAASRVAEILGVDHDATLAEILAAIPDGVGIVLGRVARELSATVAKLREANSRNRSIAECGIDLTSKLISGLAPIYMPGVAYSDGGISIQGIQVPIIEIRG
jgi:flagellar biosynthesis/type III secretory pathway chaperone